MSEAQKFTIIENKPPVEGETVTMSYWEAQQRTVVGLVNEAMDDLTSKRRIQYILRVIAMQTLALLAGAEQEEINEREKAKAEESRIIQPTGLVMP
jgi:hypothetical protein